MDADFDFDVNVDDDVSVDACVRCAVGFDQILWPRGQKRPRGVVAKIKFFNFVCIEVHMYTLVYT